MGRGLLCAAVRRLYVGTTPADGEETGRSVRLADSCAHIRHTRPSRVTPVRETWAAACGGGLRWVREGVGLVALTFSLTHVCDFPGLFIDTADFLR